MTNVKVPPSGPVNANIMIVGEAPGRDEEASLAPFVGAAGKELTSMLHEVGIARNNCFITNVCKYRPPNNKMDLWIYTKKTGHPAGFQFIKGRWVHPNIVDGIAELREEIQRVQPNIIIALGGTALWALTKETAITKWRGSVMSCPILLNGQDYVKLIPTYHPAAILRQWSWRAIAVLDLRRAAQEAAYPTITWPDYDFTIRPTIDQVVAFIHGIITTTEKHPVEPPHGPVVGQKSPPGGLYTKRNNCATRDVTLAVDIETRGGYIACVGGIVKS